MRAQGAGDPLDEILLAELEQRLVPAHANAATADQEETVGHAHGVERAAPAARRSAGTGGAGPAGSNGSEPLEQAAEDLGRGLGIPERRGGGGGP